MPESGKSVLLVHVASYSAPDFLFDCIFNGVL